MGGNSSLSSVAPEHQRNENSVPFPACASEKSRSLFFSCCLSGYLYRAATSPVEPPCISSDPFSERAGRTALREHRDFLGRAYARLNRGACSECTALCRRSAGFHHAQSKLLKNGRVRLCGIRSKDTADQIEGTMRALKAS